MKQTTAHVQQQLPLKLTESRQARLRRILNGPPAGLVQLASELSFTPSAAIRASIIAHQSNVQNRGQQ